MASKLMKMARSFNKVKGVEKIDLDQDKDEIQEDFMTLIEKMDDEGETKKLPRDIVRFYEDLARKTIEAEDGGEDEDSEDLDDLSTKELREKAETLVIDDADDMSRKELVKAIKKAAIKKDKGGDEEDIDLDDLSTSKLRAKAEDLDIDDADDMSRKELMKAIKKAASKKDKKKDKPKKISEDDLDDMGTGKIRKLAESLDIDDADDMSRAKLIKAILKAQKKKGKGSNKGKSFSKPEGALSLSVAVAKAFKKFVGKETTIKKLSNAANDIRTDSGGADNYKSANAYVKFIIDTLVELDIAEKDGNDITMKDV